MGKGYRHSRSWQRRIGTVLGICLPAAFGFPASLRAVAAEPNEYEVKAAYLYNFLSFTDWPAGIGAELRLCVYGPDPFGAGIDVLQGKTIGERTLTVERVSTVELLGACQAVFLTRDVISNLPRILDELRGRPVLTIADSPGAVGAGVAINMRSDAERISFEVNLAAVHEHDLNLSYRLLRLATEVLN